MRAAGWVATVIGLQLALGLVYFGIERSRRPEAPFLWERLDSPRPVLTIARADVPVDAPAAPHLVHFWATWCVPCRSELPILIEAAEREGVPLLAVTDEPWSVVERYFEGRIPRSVVRDTTGDAAAAWSVSGLPDTLAVRDGRVVGRVGGPRDWSTADARAFLRDLK